MEVKIRRYTSRDRKAVRHLLEGLKKHIINVDTIGTEVMKMGYGNAGMRYTLKNIAKNNGVIYVAELEGETIGYVSAIVKKKDKIMKLGTPANQKYGEIVDLFIKKEHRDRQIGRKLLHIAEEYLKKRGCTHVLIGVFWPNEDARRFYEKFGYRFCDVEYIKKV